jgi:hypothetical protein
MRLARRRRVSQRRAAVWIVIIDSYSITATLFIKAPSGNLIISLRLFVPAFLRLWKNPGNSRNYLTNFQVKVMLLTPIVVVPFSQRSILAAMPNAIPKTP